MKDVNWELTGIPYTSMKSPGGIAEAINALRAGAIAERLEALGVNDAGDLALEGPSGERGPSGLLNERALSQLVAQTRKRVSDAGSRGRRPLLIGGDCPVLLGALAAIRDGGYQPGLVMVDGHEDAWPPLRSETGEASDSEIAIALGLVEVLPAPLASLVPLVERSSVGFLGPRDGAEIADAGVDSLREQVAFFADDHHIARAVDTPPELMRVALTAIEADAFWLHLDLDVLSSQAFPAVDYPQPGGLDWRALDGLAATAASDPRCRGVSVVIYNPDLDPRRAAAMKLIDFACRLVQTR